MTAEFSHSVWDNLIIKRHVRMKRIGFDLVKDLAWVLSHESPLRRESGNISMPLR